MPETLQEALDAELHALAFGARGPLQSVVRYAMEGGKRLRGCLLLAVSHSREVSSARLLSAAAAIELLHAATLVQDDIFDRSRTRRGRPATHCAFDARLATLASDWMLAEALRMGYRLAPLFGDSLAACAQQMIAGEAEELAGYPAASLAGRRAYALAVACAKTGELFGAAGSAGALLAGDLQKAARLHVLSRDLGLAFQYLDDTLDLYGDEAAVGKDVSRDLGAQLATLPMLDACALFSADITTALLEGNMALAALALAQPRIRQHLLLCAEARWTAAANALLRALPNPGMVEALLRGYAPVLPAQCRQQVPQTAACPAA